MLAQLLENFVNHPKEWGTKPRGLRCRTALGQPSKGNQLGEDGAAFSSQTSEGLTVNDSAPAFREEDGGTEVVNGVVQPKRESYTFKGWTLTSAAPNKDGVQARVAAADVNSQRKIIYTAQWEERPFAAIGDLEITKAAAPTKAEVGQEIRYTIKVNNNRDISAAVTVTDALDPRLTFSKISESDGGKYDETTYTVTWENVNIPANGSKSLLVWVTADDAGAEVAVDTQYTPGTTVTVGEGENSGTYVFSGWSTEDASVEENRFTMPEKTVTIAGVWTKKAEGPAPGPETPAPKEAGYTVEWYEVGQQVSVTETDKKIDGHIYVGDEDGRNVLSDTLAESGAVLKLCFAQKTEPEKPGTPDELKSVSYTVVHEYYTNNSRDGESRQTVTGGKVGGTVRVEELEDGENVIVLRYDRTVSSPEDDSENDSDPMPPDDPASPKTKDPEEPPVVNVPETGDPPP